MDGVIRKKTSKDFQKEQHFSSDTDKSFFSEENSYHIFEFGRLYQRNFLNNDVRIGYDAHDQIDVRSFLEDKDSDYDVLRAYDPNALTERCVKKSNVKIFDERDVDLHYNNIVYDYSGNVQFSLSDVPVFTHKSLLQPKHISRHFIFWSIFLIAFLSTVLFIGTVHAVKKRVESASERAIASMQMSMIDLRENDLSSLNENIVKTHREFSFASAELDKINPVITYISRYVPGATKLSSGTHIVEAGKHLSHTAMEFSAILPELIDQKGILAPDSDNPITLLDIYRSFADHLSSARYDIAHAQENLEQVYLGDVPQEHQSAFVEIRNTLPQINETLRRTTEAQPVMEDVLGANGPRTYLLLFQNNQEMRATGGFIGSYGIVKINKGKVEKIFVDDIYNPDGQLIDRIVPPLPVQKISANWSLHDSNWFVDFPVSARKAIDFYERTGGPTVDGVIALTPVMIEKILEVTGPVAFDEYNLILNSNNFAHVMRDEIEDRNNYIAQESLSEKEILDQKNESQPKKILSDLMPKLIEHITKEKDPESISKLLVALSNGVKERHVLMYSSNEDMQKIIEESGWGGEVLHTDRDYLSVINTNINGFKTDGVIDETIEHVAQIDAEGYITNTLRITRAHAGGRTGYPWWDAVNANYMRIYVPQGSQLISVEGHTREINEERLDYDALGYIRDEDVVKEEQGMRIDDETGTRIYEEYGKTVFANWAYVSPQETVTVVYKYRLPHRVDFYTDEDGEFGSYAIVFQKQSGSQNSHIKSGIVLDEDLKFQWHVHGNEDLYMENNLDIDRYNGVVFRM
jgi:hypothetical protein